MHALIQHRLQIGEAKVLKSVCGHYNLEIAPDLSSGMVLQRLYLPVDRYPKSLMVKESRLWRFSSSELRQLHLTSTSMQNKSL